MPTAASGVGRKLNLRSEQAVAREQTFGDDRGRDRLGSLSELLRQPGGAQTRNKSIERRAIPFIIALNCFDGARRYDTEEVRMALDLDPDMPFVLCDARSRESAKDVLITLVEHVLMTTSEEPVSGIV